MSKNDDKIKALLTQINGKRDELGTKPKASLNTNGILRVLDSEVNINTVNSTDALIKLAAKFLLEKSNYAEACKLLDLPEQNSKRLSLINDSLADIQLRAKIVCWEAEKKKLTALEKKLKDLRSADAKTEDTLADITKDLGL